MIAAREEENLLMDSLDINWKITNSERRRFRELWDDGASLDTIAEEMNRTQLEIGLLVIEQSALGRIEQRRHGVFGY